MDAPPDVFAVCGLALDYCVHETCINAKALGMPRVSICINDARAVHIPGVGAHGSSFLSAPAVVRSSLISSGVNIVSTSTVLPQGAVDDMYGMEPVTDKTGLCFPESLDPLGLRSTTGLKIKLTLSKKAHASGQFSLSLVGRLEPFAGLKNFSNEGLVSPHCHVVGPASKRLMPNESHPPREFAGRTRCVDSRTRHSARGLARPSWTSLRRLICGLRRMVDFFYSTRTTMWS